VRTAGSIRVGGRRAAEAEPANAADKRDAIELPARQRSVDAQWNVGCLRSPAADLHSVSQHKKLPSGQAPLEDRWRVRGRLAYNQLLDTIRTARRCTVEGKGNGYC
jgi:hypothetical protein